MPGKPVIRKVHQLSVIIPAHNEEKLIGQCLASVKQAAAQVDVPVEVIVCLNRCDDNTESIAREYGAIIVEETEANVARVRNRAVAASSGDVIITLDADSRLSQNYLKEVLKKTEKGQIAGAGLMFVDKITISTVIMGILLVLPAMLLMRFSGGMFWMQRSAFDAVGGFDEHYLTGEDFQLWRSLRQQCKKQGTRFGMITRACIITSARKMDEFGPWFMLTHPHWYYHAIKGDNRAFANRYLYKTRRSGKAKHKSG